MGDLSKNFSRSEFACKGIACCDRSAPVSERLVQALQMLRDFVGETIEITSGFRCRAHNKKIGGATNSQHCLGTAADIKCEGLRPSELAAFAERVPDFANGGIGIYKSWIHVDVRSEKKRWGNA